MGVVRLKVSKDGQLCLTDELRKVLGVEDGGEVFASLEGRALRLRPSAADMEETRRILAAAVPKGARMSVDDFLAQRLRDTGQ
jgi:bifunctional DNA-binding transcriptional regulator/antitoxin component of YhaV-PrlF toxin-antitoxin module